MLIALSWKNIWRNKKRSLVIIMAITSGLWGGLFLNAVWLGMVESMVETAISRNLAHIQIHQPQFDQDRDIRKHIADGDGIYRSLTAHNSIGAVSARTLINGMASSPASAYGVNIIGVNAQNEANVCDITTNLQEGVFLDSKYRNPAVVGAKLAERLNLNLRSKIILSFQNLQGGINYLACRVVGIYKTNSTQFDEMNLYVNQADLFKNLDTKPIFHEIAVRLNAIDSLDAVKAKIENIVPGQLVETWKEIAPELAYLSDMMDFYAYFFIGIIIAALIFGITNTMLMSVVERFKEIGMLMAIGMHKSKVFIMILAETVFLSLTGGIIGIVISAVTILLTGYTGINLSFIAVSLESFGSAAMLYPYLPLSIYFTLVLLIVIAAVLASLLPAYKAIRLLPAEAIRTN